MHKEDIVAIIEALESGEPVSLAPEMVPAFSEEATQGNAHMSPAVLEAISANLTADDIPTFQRALQAIEQNELAWLGFKVVYDPQVAQQNTDNEVTKKYGEVGSADGKSMVFFCNDAKEWVAPREPSPRDIFQMKDVTRGPSMHNEQFDGLTWASVPLFENIRVWLLGASDVAVELARLAEHVGFRVVVVDCDPAYINEDRFPGVERILLPSSNFDALQKISADPSDFVCVLTRGHMFDPESCLWAIANHVSYVGMMGCAGKNSTVHDLCRSGGMTEEQWDSIVRPIGLKFGAKTPAELAIAIVAQLIDERYQLNYSEQARKKHEESLGR